MKIARTLTAYAVITFAVFTLGCNESLRKETYPPAGGSISELLPEANKIIQESLSDSDPLIRANTIEIIADTKQSKLMPRVQRLLEDDFVPVRFAAALAVGDLQYSLAENSVKRLLKDNDENVRIAADYATSKLGTGSGFSLVRQTVASSDQTVRANAALLLGKSGDKNSLKWLWWTLQNKDSDYKARFNAAEAIARLGDERIDEKLLAMLISTYADDRVMGIKAMGALGTEKAKNFLITKLDDDVLEVRLAAAEQLGMLGETIGEAEVLKVFTKDLTAGMNEEELERVNMLTALAIGQIRTASVTKFLPQLLKDESKLVRIAAAKAVIQCTIKDRNAKKASY
ncbi:MAG: HEAT repeat domain-containing protein [Phycisphaerae bacterium]|nr:HEAT repeat domain-containing protein [Phycisphaerae bacterium]MDD5381561.1 HEAT repeat domain-containing protein [Phycisphaerae bacterium]